MFKPLLLFPTLALCAACSSSPALVGRPGLTMVRAAEMPAPVRGDLSAPERAYVLGPFDRLAVEVYGIDELRREVQVDGSGHIGIPLAGSIEASGHTPAEVASEIANRLAHYVRNPQVTVNLVETVHNVLTVDGQVREPGLYPVMGRMTLMRAIASAKGLTEFADTQEVVVQRRVGGAEYAALYDLRAIRQGAYPDPEVYASDVVIVGDSEQRRLIRDLLQAAPLLTTPLIAILDNGN